VCLLFSLSVRLCVRVSLCPSDTRSKIVVPLLVEYRNGKCIPQVACIFHGKSETVTKQTIRFVFFVSATYNTEYTSFNPHSQSEYWSIDFNSSVLYCTRVCVCLCAWSVVCIDETVGTYDTTCLKSVRCGARYAHTQMPPVRMLCVVLLENLAACYSDVKYELGGKYGSSSSAYQHVGCWSCLTGFEQFVVVIICCLFKHKCIGGTTTVWQAILVYQGAHATAVFVQSVLVFKCIKEHLHTGFGQGIV
jgi:hypothetical protein